MIKLKQDLKYYIIGIIGITIYIITMELIFGLTCPFKILFHIDCPGCGLTRALISLLKGDITESLHYNYSLIFWLLTIILFIIDRYIKPFKIKIVPIFFIITCLVTIVRYIILIVFKNPIF